MPSLRLFILWIVFVCVPLQGHAAATMALCGPVRPAAAAMSTQGAAHDAHDAHDTGHAHDYDHGARPHPGDASHAGAHAGMDHGPSADAPHTCGTCAACHAVALTGRPDAVAPHALPAADLAEPALVPATRVPRVPDRPPRA